MRCRKKSPKHQLSGLKNHAKVEEVPKAALPVMSTRASSNESMISMLKKKTLQFISHFTLRNNCTRENLFITHLFIMY